MSASTAAMSRLWINVGLAAAILFCAASAFFFLAAKSGEYSQWNYDRIGIGASLGEVEYLLGRPGKKTSSEEIPNTPGRPAVQGDRYFLWKAPDGVGFIIIAIGEDGRVCDKYMFHSSL